MSEAVLDRSKARVARRRAWGFWPLFILLALAEPLVLAMDPLGAATATNAVSAAIANRVAAPLYGHAPEAEAAQEVALSTRSVAVVMIDDDALRRLETPYPLDYFLQIDIFSRILQFQPRAVFVDLLYAYDRGGLDDAMALIKEEAEAAEAPIVFASAEGTVAWTAAETLPAVKDRFETAAATVNIDGPVYPLWPQKALPTAATDAANGGAEATAPQRVRGVALSMLSVACGPGWGERNALPGCRDHESLLTPARADRPPLALRYGELSQEVWRPKGALVGLRGEAFEKKAAELRDGCRHFAPDAEGRRWEAASRFLSSLRPFRAASDAAACPYTLTIPLEQLMDDSQQANAYLAEALRDKIVFLGSAVIGAHDRVPILDSFGPGVYAHAMATDNLLNYGESYFRPPPALPLPEGLRIAGLSLEQDAVLELATSAALLLAAALIAPGAARWIAAGEQTTLRSLAVSAFWIVITTAIIALSLWLVTVALRWPAHNWVGALFYAFASRRVLLTLAERRVEA